MVSFSRFFSSVTLAAVISKQASTAKTFRNPSAQRLRNPNSDTVYGKLYKNTLGLLGDTNAEEQDELDAIMEIFGSMETSMSMDPITSDQPSTAPSVSDSPSEVPSTSPTSGPATDAPTPAPVDAIPIETDAPATDIPETGAIEAGAPETDAPETDSASCTGITEQERVDQILAILDEVADDGDIRDPQTPQGKATEWIIAQDTFGICPDNKKLVQRWALAVMYYSTGGDEWFRCSAVTGATDNCGSERPFRGKERFLSDFQECEWAGITCDSDECVTEIEFESNNLVGTIATEIGLLEELTIWGMERGALSSTIPTEIGGLSNLIFIDLDYNELTGALSSELLSLSSLEELDLNNNNLSGNLNGLGVFPNITFIQLHNNLFTGTVPESIGTLTELTALTLHNTSISGTMPESVCSLLGSEDGNGGALNSLVADCQPPNPNIICDCCTECRAPTT